jgi:hypothetical protein
MTHSEHLMQERSEYDSGVTILFRPHFPMSIEISKKKADIPVIVQHLKPRDSGGQKSFPHE